MTDAFLVSLMIRRFFGVGFLTNAPKGYQIRLLGKTKHIQDPRSFLHFIPWKELRLTDDGALKAASIRLTDPFSSALSTSDVFLWKPPFPGFVWNHHLRTEDEVFAYSIREGWQLPDHSINGSVIFVATPIEKTKVVEELGKFWDKWVGVEIPLNLRMLTIAE